MEHIRHPFRGVLADIKGRALCYRRDWLKGFRSGAKIVAPTTFMFFASAVTVVALGEQLNKETDGQLSTCETLASTAICGVIHSVLGGQPLLILGVADLTVTLYSYLYHFVKRSSDLETELFLAWTAWVCIWTACMLLLLAVFNACAVISKFTRIVGELFGILTAVLFIRDAIQGVVSEFHLPKGEDSSLPCFKFEWLYANGLLGVIFTTGVLYTAGKSRSARAWHHGTVCLRNVIADYGVPLMVLVWSALSYAVVPSKVPSGVPRRLFSPLPWESESLHHWVVARDLLSVPPGYIFFAIIPAVFFAGFYFFEHNVASQMSQQKEHNLEHPSAYHYDTFILGFMVLFCGLLGIPPSIGLLPQSPMHTKSLALLKRQTVQSDEKSKQQDCGREIDGKTQEDSIQIGIDHTSIAVEGETGGEDVIMQTSEGGNPFDPGMPIESYLSIEVNEQRVTNLCQSLMVGACIGAMPIIKKIPTSVLWGYFAYLAIDSLPGNQFWERILFLFITPGRRYKVLEDVHASFMERVPYKVVAAFTIFQFLYLLFCFGVTLIPVAGFLFVLPLYLLIAIRHYILPKFFEHQHLQVLDAAEYEEIIGAPQQDLCLPHRDTALVCSRINSSVELSAEIISTEIIVEHSAELLDELTTSRGELKLRNPSSSH